jgi:hypothetical protein
LLINYYGVTRRKGNEKKIYFNAGYAGYAGYGGIDLCFIRVH